ncbi:MAG: hypothetical protein QM296_02920, partial [Bacillota bacterium]|nr:hypothetical protein [Bacillota bacterium]
GGQKLRWCPENRAGTKKLSKGGQKLRWCPENRAGTKKLSTAISFNWRCGTAAFSFLFFITKRRQTNRQEAVVRAALAVLL